MSNQFNTTAPVVVNHTVGEPITVIKGNHFKNTPTISIQELNFPGPHTAKLSANTYENNTKD